MAADPTQRRTADGREAAPGNRKPGPPAGATRTWHFSWGGTEFLRLLRTRAEPVLELAVPELVSDAGYTQKSSLLCPIQECAVP